MTITNAIGSGVRAVREKWLALVLLYAATTAGALLLTAAAMAVVVPSLGHSLWAGQMADSFNIEWVAEMIANTGGAPAFPLFAAAIGVCVVFALLHLFLLGGVLDLICLRRRFAAREFFAACGRWVGPLVRLVLYAVLVALVPLLLNGMLQKLGTKLFENGSEATPLQWWTWARVSLLLVLLAPVDAAFDYAALRMAREELARPLSLLKWGLGFVWRNRQRTLPLYIVLRLLATAGLALYLAVAAMLRAPVGTVIVLLLVVRQVAVAGKVGWRMVSYASERELLESLEPVPVPVVEEVPAGGEAGPQDCAGAPAPAL